MEGHKKKQNVLFALVYLISLLLIVGFTNNNVASDDYENDISELESRILELDQANEKQQLVNEEQEKRIIENEMKLETIQESLNVFHNNFYAMNQLIDLTLDSKTAILNHAEVKGDLLNLNITFTEKIGDQDAPNGFHLVETEGGTKTLCVSKNVPIYLLKNVASLIPVEWDKVVAHRGLLQLYEKNGEVVFISEIYIP